MTSAIRSKSRGFQRGRGGSERHDPYRSDAKLAGPGCCPGCGAVYLAGRWSWRRRPIGARGIECPACARIRERCPAGVLRLDGNLGSRRDELLGLVRNVEERERLQHPLERVIAIRARRGGLVVETTGVHLARRITDALERAFHSAAELDFAPGEELLRARWTAPEA
ncbi:MAG: BCAM0308 family protein [Planctomycetota bacterium]|nr:BCAM0308 family protein [Planctomycetota bacterium]